MTRLGHLGAVAAATFGVRLLATLAPAASGYGTHQALGLPPCPFFAATRLPCPSCGLTTSLVHLLHGEWIASWRAHPSGPIVLVIGVVFLIVNLYGVARPVPLGRWIANPRFHRGVVCAMGWFLSTWVIRLFMKWPS